MAIQSPCVKSCRLDEDSQLCYGCGRTMDEIVNWRTFSDAEREAIMTQLKARIKETFEPVAMAINPHQP